MRGRSKPQELSAAQVFTIAREIPTYAYKIAAQTRNKVNHIPVGRLEEDCPKKAAFLAELAAKRKKKQQNEVVVGRFSV